VLGGEIFQWNPKAYERFRDFRLRPVLDLIAQVPSLPEGEIIDLGCGAGAARDALAERWRDRDIIGVDASQAMLDRTQGYARSHLADIATWSPQTPPALIFSNAALHWLGDHARLFPRLAGYLAPQGVLAVQMPNQFLAPSHEMLRQVAAQLFPDLFDFSAYAPPVAPLAAYLEMLEPLGAVTAWETTYLQVLPADLLMHPVRTFTASTAMLPFAKALTQNQFATLGAGYDAALARAYPLRQDGTALMPFSRIFLILQV